MERESAEKGARAAQEHLAQRQAEEVAGGKKKRGRKPKVVESTVAVEAKANITDPDSRIMKTRQGYIQGYNAQAIVSEDQIIVAVGVTQEGNDVQQLKPMLEAMERTLEVAGIKEGQGFGRFMRRGLRAAQSEWSLEGTTHNLLKPVLATGQGCGGAG